MKILSYKKGKLVKVTKSRRKAPDRVKWAPVHVPRDTGSAWFTRPYPDEKRELMKRRYQSTSGEGPFRGKKIFTAQTMTQQVTRSAKQMAKAKVTTAPKATRRRKTHKAYSVKQMK